MEAHAIPFRDLAYVIIAAITGGFVAWRLRLPLIIGYVLAGIVISPLTPGPSVSNVRSLELFAEIGVVLLMFSIGLEFSIKELLKAKWVAFLGGPLGIILCILLGLAAGHLMGWPVSQGILLGAITSIASTMVLTRLLGDQGQLRTTAGRIMISIALVEDLAVVVLIILIPGLSELQTSRVLSLGKDIGLAVLILAPILFLAAKIVPPLMKQIARTQSRELFFLIVLAICLGTAALTSAVGLSLALGSFAAGLIISESDYAHEAIAQLFPLRDAFAAIFFVSIGLLVNPREIFANPSILFIMLGIIFIGNFIVWTSVVFLFRHSLLNAVLVAIGFTQIGEFSFVMVQVARNAGIVGNEMYNATLAASLISILLNAALFRRMPAALTRMRLAKIRAQRHQEIEEIDNLSNHVIICGFGRVGSAIGYALEAFGIKHLAVETDPDVLESVQASDISYIFGDCAHAHILERAGISRASLLIVTVPDLDRARLAITHARKLHPNLPIMARAHRKNEYQMLMEAGASEVILPELEASATFIRHACGHYLMLPDVQIREYLRTFRDAVERVNRSEAWPKQTVPEVREVAINNPALAGLSLQEAKLREIFGITVVSIRRVSGEMIPNPSPSTSLLQNDRVRVLGWSNEIDKFAEQSSAEAES